mgnify:FL=1
MKLKMPRWLYLLSMIVACVSCGVSFVVDVFNFSILLADAPSLDGNYLAAQAISLGLETFVFLGLFLTSLLFLTLRRFRGKDAVCLPLFASIFLLSFGSSTFATGVYSRSDVALLVCIGVSTLVLGAVGLGLRGHFPAWRVVSIVGLCAISIWFWYSFFALCSLKNPYAGPNFLLASSMVLLVVGLVKIEATKEESAPHEIEGGAKNPTPEELSMLVKYKELLDGGVITQEDFDKAKKRILG